MMKRLLRSFTALPADRLGRHPDVLLAVGVLTILAMLIIPMPPILLDGLLSANILFSALILLTALFARNALSFSSFPSLLLVTTVCRLALNVSTTRLILSKADAGHVVRTFGQFVIQGDLVVGIVIFLVLTLVQFLVIAKGAERVAEVAARFTLDAMPGKQMSIDAALRNGAIDDKEADRRRSELSRESQLFGAMDGAMKFVKGDAIAGLIITAINLVAGLVIGVVRLDMPLGSAVELYSILTIGDGLVSQVPALLITLSSGLVTTRSAPKDDADSLGRSLVEELFHNDKVVGLAACVGFLFGLVPGFPLLPFWSLGSAAVGIIVVRRRRAGLVQGQADSRKQLEKRLEASVSAAKAQQSMVDAVAPTVVPVGLDLDPVLTRALGFGGGEMQPELLGELIPQLRDAIYVETGIRIPGVRVRSNVQSLPERTFCVRIKDVPILQASLRVDGLVAMKDIASLRRLGVNAEAVRHPMTGAEASLIDPADQEVVEASGVSVWTPGGMIALYLLGVLRKNVKEFLGIHEVGEMVERLEKAYPMLVREVVPKVVNFQQLVDVLVRLADERVSIRDLKSIIEALAKYGIHENDGVSLTERVRAALSLQIAHAHAGLSGQLDVVLLDPIIEETVRSAITETHGGTYLALEPEISRSIIDSVMETLRPMLGSGSRPIILTTSTIRRYFRKLIEHEVPETSVLSFEELPGNLSVQPLGRIMLKDGFA